MAVRRAFAPPGIVVILHPERSSPSRRYTTRIALPRRHAAATIDGEKPLDFGKPILMIFGGLFCIRSIPSPDGSELCFCPTNYRLSDKNARPAGPLRRSRVAPPFLVLHRGFQNGKWQKLLIQMRTNPSKLSIPGTSKHVFDFHIYRFS